ncbi:MAG: ral secretion pathway protein [Rhodospirillales bacterium]|jgi:general secretion pathway protein I|nr:ral secretion pathway protein [Rhodospirillales bacterium]
MSSMLPRANDPTAGFTLIEALVAFAVAAVLLGAIYDIYSTGMRGATGGARYGTAVLIAQSALESLTNVQLSPGETTDRVGIFARHTTVRVRTDLVPPGSQLALTPYEVVVRIDWHEGVRQRALSLSTLRLSPP